MRLTTAGICVAFTLVSRSIFAGDVEFPTDNSECFQCDSATPEDFAPAFIENVWYMPAIEGCVEDKEETKTYSFEELQRKLKTETQQIDRKRIFQGAWAPPKRSDRHSGYALPSSRSVPPIDDDWLTNAVWPRTRSYLETSNAPIFGSGGVAYYR
jgi:hypothetical protein